MKINDQECDKAGISGDAGLDLIAIVNFADGAATNYAVFGQCGAQETAWPKKTLEAHPIRFRSYFQTLMEHPAIMFIPVCYRTASGEWYDNQAASGVLLLDRSRILHLLQSQDKWDEIVDLDWFQKFERELEATIAPA